MASVSSWWYCRRQDPWSPACCRRVLVLHLDLSLGPKGVKAIYNFGMPASGFGSRMSGMMSVGASATRRRAGEGYLFPIAYVFGYRSLLFAYGGKRSNAAFACGR